MKFDISSLVDIILSKKGTGHIMSPTDDIMHEKNSE